MVMAANGIHPRHACRRSSLATEQSRSAIPISRWRARQGYRHTRGGYHQRLLGNPRADPREQNLTSSATRNYSALS